MRRLLALILALATAIGMLGIFTVTATEFSGTEEDVVITTSGKKLRGEAYLEAFVTDEAELSAYKARIEALEGETLDEILDEAETTYQIVRETLKYEKTAAVTDGEILAEAVSEEGASLGDEAVLTLSGNTIKGAGLGRALIRTGGTLKAIKVEKAPIALVLISGQSNSAGDYSDYREAPKATGEYEDKYMITNSMNCTLSDARVTYEDAVYTAENGGRSQYAEEGLFDSNHPEITWASRNLSAGAASTLGARLSDEWDMKVWVVNTGICAQIMDRFDPENASHGAYTSTLKYVNKVKSLITENGHFILDTSKTGLFWLQGESDGIGTSSENTMAEYTDMFMNMYNGFVSELGINYAGIWLVRSGLNNNGAVDFYMSGPRLAQYYLGNSSKEEHKNIYLILDTDIWRTDVAVKAYFDAKYPDSAAFSAKYGYALPQTTAEIKPDIHHRQKGYNELGDEAGINIQSIMEWADEPVTEGYLKDYYGNRATEFYLEIGGDAKANVAVPIVTTMNYNASAGLYVTVEDETIATYDNDTFMFTPLKEGSTKAKLYSKTTLLGTYDVTVEPQKIKFVDREGWSATASSTWTAAGRDVSNLLDGKLGTAYTADINLPLPQHFEIDLAKTTKISGFAFDPYTDSSNTPTGYPTEYNLYGKIGEGDYVLIKHGTFVAENGVSREVSFNFNVEVDKVKFEYVKSINNFAAMAEFNLLVPDTALLDRTLTELSEGKFINYALSSASNHKGDSDAVFTVSKEVTAVSYNGNPVEFTYADGKVTITRPVIRNLDNLYILGSIALNFTYADETSDVYTLYATTEALKVSPNADLTAYPEDEIVPTSNWKATFESTVSSNPQNVFGGLTSGRAWLAGYSTGVVVDHPSQPYYLDLDMARPTEFSGIRYKGLTDSTMGNWTTVKLYGRVNETDSWSLITEAKNLNAAVVGCEMEVNFEDNVKLRFLRFEIKGVANTASALSIGILKPVYHTVKLEIEESDGGSVLVNGEAYEGAMDIIRGEDVTLSANPVSGASFYAWVSAHNNAIVSKEQSFTTKLYSNRAFVPVFTYVDAEGNTCIFVGGDSVISIGKVSQGVASAIAPSAIKLYRTGYDFAGWKVSGNDIDITTYPVSAPSVFDASYVKKTGDEYKVTIVTDAHIDKEPVDGKYDYDTLLTVTASETNGTAAFSHFEDGDGTVLSTDRVYSFYAIRDMEIYACYEEAKTEPTVKLSVTEGNHKGYSVAKFLMERSIPSGATLLEQGIIYLRATANEDELTAENAGNKSIGGELIKSAVSRRNESQYILSVGQTGGVIISARAYVAYKDEAGKVKYVYSDMVKYENLNGLSETKITDKNVRMVGRYYEDNGTMHSSFTSSGLEFKFRGTSAYLKLNVEGTYDAYLHVFVDGNEVVYQNYEDDNRLLAGKGESVISLCTNLPDGDHTVKIVKANEESRNRIGWISILTDGVLLAPPSVKDRKIQFFGDSFTCGYNNMNFPDNNDSKDFGAMYQDGELTYAAYITRALNADRETYARSGVAAYSIFNSSVTEDYYSNASYLYPELGTWDHTKFEPDVIVQYNWINDVLGAMDKSGVTKEEMTVAYLNMITKFREAHPNAKIVIVGYSERADFTALVNDAIARYGAAGNDNSGIVICETSYYGNHPFAAKAEEIANEIIPVIKEVTGWN